MDGKLGWWLAILAAIPISLAVNLLTPFVERRIARTSETYRTWRLAGLRLRKIQVNSALQNPTWFLAHVMWETCGIVALVVGIGCGLVVFALADTRVMSYGSGMLVMIGCFWAFQSVLKMQRFLSDVARVSGQPNENNFVWSVTRRQWVEFDVSEEELLWVDPPTRSELRSQARSPRIPV